MARGKGKSPKVQTLGEVRFNLTGAASVVDIEKELGGSWLAVKVEVA